MLSLEQIARLAHLARLELAPDEAVAMQRELNDILGMVDRMSAVDTSGIEPMSHPQDVEQRMRDDVVTETDARERFQGAAPQVQDGLYLVPKVIE
jgi:aspartyl-tRNA(Asn)/glutamyl-tRNA(Gln) amidotransferase subunit C